MMNGRPEPAVRALMGAGELYITLLSVCERLLKALQSPRADTGRRPATKLHRSRNKGEAAAAQVLESTAKG